MAHNLHHNHQHSHHTQTHPVTGKPTRRDLFHPWFLLPFCFMGPRPDETQSASDMAERFRQMSEEYESKDWRCRSGNHDQR
jgi:hypothetical protein